MGKYDGEGEKLSSEQVGCEIPERYPDSNIYEVVDSESKAGFGKFFLRNHIVTILGFAGHRCVTPWLVKQP